MMRIIIHEDANEKAFFECISISDFVVYMCILPQAKQMTFLCL